MAITVPSSRSTRCVTNRRRRRDTVSSTPSRRTDRNRSGTVACSTTARIAARHPSPTSSAASATARPRVTASATAPGSDAPSGGGRRPGHAARSSSASRTSARGTPIVASSTAPSPAAPPRWHPRTHHRPLLDLADHAALRAARTGRIVSTSTSSSPSSGSTTAPSTAKSSMPNSTCVTSSTACGPPSLRVSTTRRLVGPRAAYADPYRAVTPLKDEEPSIEAGITEVVFQHRAGMPHDDHQRSAGHLVRWWRAGEDEGVGAVDTSAGPARRSGYVLSNGQVDTPSRRRDCPS